MRSVRDSRGADDDRTARARIRDAAIGCFADHGYRGTSVRAIAEAAGVSAGLVIHHFGSKDALRVACDEHVAGTIRTRKAAAMSAGPPFDPVAALRTGAGDPPLMRYLARTLVEGSPHTAELVDELVAGAADYTAEGVRTGVLRPTTLPYERAAVLTLWSLGVLVLHEHLQRLLGVDLTAAEQDPSAMAPYITPVLEVFSEGLLTQEAAAQMRAAFAAAAGGRDDEHKEAAS
ncbi:MAG TPA: TetR family transcriptional regulator [Egibacteraceae bacterium]|nr:TetR family transcriptional regulator [Egibacteraceae bacterium]